MTANLRRPRLHYDTCSACGGPRSGCSWRSRGGGGAPVPVCQACAGAPHRSACPLRCGPGGLVGPKCRFGEGHVGLCLPRGRMPLLLSATRPAGEAVHA